MPCHRAAWAPPAEGTNGTRDGAHVLAGFRGGKVATPSPWRTADAQRRQDSSQTSRKCALSSSLCSVAVHAVRSIHISGCRVSGVGRSACIPWLSLQPRGPIGSRGLWPPLCLNLRAPLYFAPSAFVGDVLRNARDTSPSPSLQSVDAARWRGETSDSGRRSLPQRARGATKAPLPNGSAWVCWFGIRVAIGVSVQRGRVQQ
jgi:hypothetical protein